MAGCRTSEREVVAEVVGCPPGAVTAVPWHRVIGRDVLRAAEASGSMAVWIPKRGFPFASPEDVREALHLRGYRIHPRSIQLPARDDGMWLAFERMPLAPAAGRFPAPRTDVMRTRVPEAFDMLARVDEALRQLPADGTTVVYGSGVGASSWALSTLGGGRRVVGLEDGYELLDYAMTNYSGDAVSFRPLGRTAQIRGSAQAYAVLDSPASPADYSAAAYQAQRALSPGGRLVVCAPGRLLDADTGRVATIDERAVAAQVGGAFRISSVANVAGGVCVAFDLA